MAREIMRVEAFLAQRAELATPEDLPVAQPECSGAPAAA